eukprot:365227-Chlamydomonas_euryale.AAC.7
MRCVADLAGAHQRRHDSLHLFHTLHSRHVRLGMPRGFRVNQRWQGSRQRAARFCVLLQRGAGTSALLCLRHRRCVRACMHVRLCVHTCSRMGTSSSRMGTMFTPLFSPPAGRQQGMPSSLLPKYASHGVVVLDRMARMQPVSSSTAAKQLIWARIVTWQPVTKT